jgi:hypothetical protein
MILTGSKEHEHAMSFGVTTSKQNELLQNLITSHLPGDQAPLSPVATLLQIMLP